MGEGLAHAEVVEWRLGRVQEDQRLVVGPGGAVDTDVVALQELDDGRIARVRVELDVTRFERLAATLLLGDHLEGHGVEVREALVSPPVVVVADHAHRIALVPLLEHERAGADERVVVADRVGRHHRAGLSGQHEGVGGPRSGHRDPDRQVVDLGDLFDGTDGEPDRGRGPERLEVGDDRRRVDRLAVVETDVGPQGDRPLREVVVGREVLGQVGDPVVVHVDRHERVVHRPHRPQRSGVDGVGQVPTGAVGRQART